MLLRVKVVTIDFKKFYVTISCYDDNDDDDDDDDDDEGKTLIK